MIRLHTPVERWGRRLFAAAGLFGIVELIPTYFFANSIGERSAPLTHPEYYYGFIGVALAWQLAFLLIASDPRRYRLIAIPGALEKLLFVVPCFLLDPADMTPGIRMFAAIDLGWAIAFLAWLWVSRSSRKTSSLYVEARFNLESADRVLFERYEVAVLPLLADHAGRLCARHRSADGRHEVHLLAFPTEEAWAAYRADPRRLQHATLFEQSRAVVDLIELRAIHDPV